MEQTTTHIAACNAIIEVDNSSGAATDISGSANNAGIDFTREIGTGTTFTGDFKLKTGCKRDAKMSIGILWTTATGEARDVMEEWYDTGGSRTISVYPNGKVIGSRFYTGEWILSDYKMPIAADSADVIKMDISAESDGAVGFMNVGS